MVPVSPGPEERMKLYAPAPLRGKPRSQCSTRHRRRRTDSEQAGTQGFDLRTIGCAERGDQKTVFQRVAAVARMAPQADLDQHIDLALEQLVQARWLANAGSDLGLSQAELHEPPPQIVD